MGIMITIFVIIIIIITTIKSSLSLALEFRAGRSSVELYHILRPRPLATRNPTSNSNGRWCRQPQPQGEGARGNPQHREPQEYHGVGGEGGLAALHHTIEMLESPVDWSLLQSLFYSKRGFARLSSVAMSARFERLLRMHSYAESCQVPFPVRSALMQA